MRIAATCYQASPLLGVILCTICLAALPERAHADRKSDFYIQQATDRYFTLPKDARSLAMGGASSLTCLAAACVYMNPAALGFLSTASLSASAGTRSVTGDEFLSGDQITLEEWNGYLVGALPLGVGDTDAKGARAKYGTIAGAYSRYAGNTDDALSTTPDGHRRTFGVGYAIDEQVSFGYAFHFLDDQLRTDLSDAHSHGRFYHDFATQILLPQRYVIGASFRLGIGQTDTEDFVLKSNGVSHLRQYTGEIAVSKTWDPVTAVFAVGYTHQSSEADSLEFSEPVVIDGNESGEDINIRLGTEYQISQSFLLRAGARYRNTTYDFSREKFEEIEGRLLAFGAGLGLGYVFALGQHTLRLDYGAEYTDAGYGSWEQILSLSVEL
jgi:hypothetical protein